MAKNYEHLSDMERALIQAKLETGCKLRAIARSSQRSASTISRELSLEFAMKLIASYALSTCAKG